MLTTDDPGIKRGDPFVRIPFALSEESILPACCSITYIEPALARTDLIN